MAVAIGVAAGGGIISRPGGAWTSRRVSAPSRSVNTPACPLAATTTCAGAAEVDRSREPSTPVAEDAAADGTAGHDGGGKQAAAPHVRGPSPARHDRADPQLAQLRRIDTCRCAGQRVAAGRGLRERDHVADGALAGQLHDQAIEPERHAAVRRRAELERAQQEPEPLVRLLGVEPNHGEDPLLKIGPIDADAAPAQLEAVHHDVIRLGEHRARIRL